MSKQHRVNLRMNLALSMIGAALCVSAGTVHAVPVLYEYAFNIDGGVSEPIWGDPIPTEADISGFDSMTGLGTIIVTLAGAGSHNVDLFVDHEVDETTNTFFNETGSTSGVPAVGQSWEIDEPGFGSLLNGSGGTQYFGDIYSNFTAGFLDNQIFYDAFDGQTLTQPDDVSMALGWDFTLAADEIAEIVFNMTETIPTGFYLAQNDLDSGASIYFSTSLTKKPSGAPGIPAPAPLLLLGAGLLGMGAIRGRKAEQA